MGIVEECRIVLEWIESQVGTRHEVYLKQKTIMTSLDSIKSQFLFDSSEKNIEEAENNG